MPSPSQETIILHGPVQRRVRTTSRGTKQRHTIAIEARPVAYFFDDVALGRQTALAITEAIKERIKEQRLTASAGTLETRKYQEAAYQRQERWALKRFGGGRLGPQRPALSDALFVNSGRFVRSLIARANPSEGGWTINVAANRLDRGTFASDLEFRRMIDKLLLVVPELGSPRKLLNDPEVAAAIHARLKPIVRRLERAELLSASLRRERVLAALRLVGGTIQRLVTS